MISGQNSIISIGKKGGLHIIVGNYGSGKTEVSVNLSVLWKRAGLGVSIVDLDLVNPYFRTREVKGVLSAMGIHVVLPPDQYLHADLPILSPSVAGLIRQQDQLTILDVGGNDVGAIVLSSLADAFKNKGYRMYQVVNPFRPFTDSIEGCLKIKSEIESASKLTVNGFIGNANLIDDTTETDVYKGYEFMKALSGKTGIPIEFITASANLIHQLDMNRFSCPVLTIERQLVPPWKKAIRLI